MSKIKIRTPAFVFLETLIEIWSILFMVYGILGILFFWANGFSLKSSDFATFPVLLLLVGAMYFIRKNLSVFKKSTKSMEKEEHKVGDLPQFLSQISQSIFATVVYFFCMITNIMEQTFGMEAMLLVLCIGFLGLINLIYLNKLKSIGLL